MIGACALALALVAAGPAPAEEPNPRDAGPDGATDRIATEEHGPLPASVRVKRDHAVVRLAPKRESRRRGEVMRGARLPVLSSADGPGCRSEWYEVHDHGWICGDLVQPSDQPPSAPRYPIVPQGEATPWPYAFVRETAIEYRRSMGVLEEVREVQKGFGFGVEGIVNVGGERYYRTAEGNLIEKRAMGVTGRISELSGIRIAPGDPWPVGWVNSKRAFAYSKPARAKKHRVGPVERYRRFEVLETTGEGRGRFFRFEEGAWLSARDVRVATDAPVPESVEGSERWIDVHVAEQVLTAYEGATPVYATLISSGRGGPSRTLRGEFRIWAKVSAIAMDNTDEVLEEEVGADAGVEDERHLYSLHDVPWTQFFHESYALHGVYWHNRFGNRRSHGCVNLSPADAQWLWEWTEPHLPNGWWAVHTAPSERATLVRVR